MKLSQRLAALEKGLVSGSAILSIPDGSVVTLPGRNDQLVRLLGCVFGGPTLEQEVQLDLIRRSTGSTEPGGGHLIELIRAVLLSPVQEEPEPGEPANLPVPGQVADRTGADEEIWREDESCDED
jgi:hypothetical protein